MPSGEAHDPGRDRIAVVWRRSSQPTGHGDLMRFSFLGGRPNQRIFFVHIMKTAGTSLRQMFLRALRNRDDLYPNDRDLRLLPNGWYPPAVRLIDDMKNGRLRDFQILCGHYPSILGGQIFPEAHHTLTMLREPIERSLSMLAHWKRHVPGYRDSSFEELIEKRSFVRSHIANYQTKVFAFSAIEQCPDSVNAPLDIGPAEFAGAVEQVRSLSFVGLTERFDHSSLWIQKLTGLKFRRTLHRNGRRKGGQRLRARGTLEQRLIDLNEFDLKLYEVAREMFEERLSVAEWAR